jgi:hypothetical protein
MGIEIYRLEKWREKALSGIDSALVLIASL